MEVYKKVRDYLCDHVGNMTAPGTPRYDEEEETWRVPVLCKTEHGVFIVGEIWLNKELEFIRIPPKEEMLKILRAQAEKLPYLVYARKEELEERGIKAVVI